MSELVSVEDHGRVRHLILDRPEKRNAFNADLVLALREAAGEAARRPRRLVRGGAGRGRRVQRRHRHLPAGRAGRDREPAPVPARRDRDGQPPGGHDQARGRADPWCLHRPGRGARARLRPARDGRRRQVRPAGDQARPDPRRGWLQPPARGGGARHRQGAADDRPHDRRATSATASARRTASPPPPSWRRSPRSWSTSCWRPPRWRSASRSASRTGSRSRRSPRRSSRRSPSSRSWSRPTTSARPAPRSWRSASRASPATHPGATPKVPEAETAS